MEAVAEAQEELNAILKEWDEYQHRLELEQQVEDFENAKNETIEDIDEEIDRLQDLKDKWGDALDIEDEVGEYSEWLDELERFENASYEERLEMLADFIASWNKSISGMKSPSVSIGSGGGSGGSSSKNPNTGGSGGSGATGGHAIGGGSLAGWKPSGSSSSNKGSGATGGHAIGGGSMAGWRPTGATGKRALGTRSEQSPGVHMVGEEGRELQIINRGDGVLTNRITENLMDWGNFTPQSFASKLPGFKRIANTASQYSFSFDNLVLPNVSNAESFISELKNKSMRMAVQIQSQRS